MPSDTTTLEVDEVTRSDAAPTQEPARARRMRKSIRIRLIAGYAVALVFLGLIGVTSLVNSQALLDNNESVSHTHEVLGAADAVLSLLKDAETGQRGYLIAGEDRYLEPFTAASESVTATIDTLQSLTSDNPAQQERIAELRPLVDAKFTEMTQTIDLRREYGFDDARAVVMSDTGKAVMDEIRRVLTEITDAEDVLLAERAAAAAAAGDATKAVVLGGTGLAIVALVVIAVFLVRSIVRPIRALTNRLREIADGDGDLTQRVVEHGDDEIGVLGGVFNRFVDNIAQLVREIGHSAQTSAAAAQELSVVSAEMSRQADDAATQATLAAAAAQQVSGNVQSVAAASEQMGASIGEIARSASDASKAGHTAVNQTAEANATVTRLGDSSAAVGGVVALINSIAEQTNLLALNATIEAARAGDAGKGFAVVASEVKDLAQETARATEEITQRIAEIQQDIAQAVTAISSTSEVIGRVNEHQSSIAGAVEEQSVTTSSMAGNVSEAATAASSIAANVQALAANAEQTVGSIGQVRTSADELAATSLELDQLVGRFKV